VATVVGMVADGMSEPEIVAAYPDLEAEDVREAIRYAAEAACKSGSAYGGSAAQERPNTRSADGPPFDVTE